MALSQPRMSCLLHERLASLYLIVEKGIWLFCGHVRAAKATGGRVDPRACPGHWLLLLVASNRLSSQLSGCGPLVRAVRAVLVVAVEALGGQQEDLARGRHPEGEQHSAVALSTVSFSSLQSLFTRSSSTIRHTKTGNCPFQRCSNRSSRPVNIFHQQLSHQKATLWVLC